MFKWFLKDSFVPGIIIGLIISASAYYSYVHFEELFEGSGTLRLKLYPPRLQLIILALSMILFRFMIVRWNMLKTGQGLFLTVFIVAIMYFFNHRYKFF